MLNEKSKNEVTEICGKTGSRIRFNEPLDAHSTISIGSSADIWIMPKDSDSAKEIISYLKNFGIKIFVLGNGSNVLMPDEPFSGAIINLSSDYFTRVEFSGNEVTCASGVKLPEFVSLSAGRGLSGMEGLVGIPATIGGAIYLNAGYLTTISDHLTRVRVLRGGKVEWINKEDIKFSYRNSSLNREDVVLEAIFSLEKASSDEIKNKIKENMADKISKQPLNEKSLGCAFKNPEGHKSAELIDKAGLKGRRVGDAKVSEKHANFIINVGKATQADYVSLMEVVKKEVKEKFKVELESEIEILKN